MCGLVGMVGTLEYKHRAAMEDLLFLNSLRGKDSTGLSVVNRDRTVLTRKMTVPGYEFIEYPAVKKAMTHHDQIWMGHGRFKTTGEISRANAHPFEVIDNEGDIILIGTHNGTINNKWEIEKEIDKKFDTDSEAIFHWMTEAATYKEAIRPLRGAWSFVWWDPTVDSLHFLRNEERPMTYAFTKDRKVLVYASEAWMIINACRRNGVELLQNDKGLACYATLTDNLYTLEIPQEPGQELPDMRKEGGYAGTPVNNFQGKWNQWWDNPKAKEERERKEEERKKKAQTNGKKEDQKVVTLGHPKGHLRGFEGTPVSLEEFQDIKAKGCGWCKGEIPDRTIFSFLNEDTIVCVNCMRDTHPKDCVHQSDDFLDDDLPFDLTDKGKGELPKNSKEYKNLIAAAVTGAKAVG